MKKTTKTQASSASETLILTPVFVVYGRFFLIGVLLAAVGHFSFLLGQSLSTKFTNYPVNVLIILIALPVCGAYGVRRGGADQFQMMMVSKRIDLLLLLLVGFGFYFVLGDELVHQFDSIRLTLIRLTHIDPRIPVYVFVALFGLCVWSVVIYNFERHKERSNRNNKSDADCILLPDQEAKSKEHDLLGQYDKAQNFAQWVFKEGCQQGLIFGVDGPWGAGKSSFVNFAKEYWKEQNHLVVCRFDPLKYSSDSNLSIHLLHELTEAIQQKIFAPELPVMTRRLSRLLQPTELSYLGVKLTINPMHNTISELLVDIGAVLKRNDLFLVVVIDDLDRLPIETVKKVLFAAHQSLRLQRAAYVFCYDSEILLNRQSRPEHANLNEVSTQQAAPEIAEWQFLEKFVQVKVNVLIEPKQLIKLLTVNVDELIRQGRDGAQPNAISRAGSEQLFNTIAEFLEQEHGFYYLQLLGDIRKLKRFNNLLVILDIHSNLPKDLEFKHKDLLHLIVLYQNYPSVFRRISFEEANNRQWTRSVKQLILNEYNNNEYQVEFKKFFASQPELAQFLLKQLSLNEPSSKNFKYYLSRIVGENSIEPIPIEQFKFDEDLSLNFIDGKQTLEGIFNSDDFNLAKHAERFHDLFWKRLSRKFRLLNLEQANQVIDTIIRILPRHSLIHLEFKGVCKLRELLITDLIKCLDQLVDGDAIRTQDKDAKVQLLQPIIDKIFGPKEGGQLGILALLVHPDRGVLGWFDAMTFWRCVANLQSNSKDLNVHQALCIHAKNQCPAESENSNGQIGYLRDLAQKLFGLFKQGFIDKEINFFAQFDQIQNVDLIGDLGGATEEERTTFLNQLSESDRTIISRKRVEIKIFLVYQLFSRCGTNSLCCGYFDATGCDDNQGISTALNAYAFKECFNPDTDANNALLFVDYFLYYFFEKANRLRFNLDLDNNKKELLVEVKKEFKKNDEFGPFNLNALGNFWRKHNKAIQTKANQHPERQLVLSNSVTTYAQGKDELFKLLDELIPSTDVEGSV